jgi:DNA repair protein RecN (Recombination protein N)
MSLLCLHLENFVIVEQLAIDFSAGFSVLTGETGAGKSILIDALQLVLGAKADATVIREGATKTVLCAEFAPSASAQQWLLAQDLSTDDATIALRRVVDRQGKSKAWINGTPCSASQLKQLGGLLIDIHGQHAWQSLTKAETTRQLLDEYGAIDTQPLKTAWQQW